MAVVFLALLVGLAIGLSHARPAPAPRPVSPELWVQSASSGSLVLERGVASAAAPTIPFVVRSSQGNPFLGWQVRLGFPGTSLSAADAAFSSSPSQSPFLVPMTLAPQWITSHLGQQTVGHLTVDLYRQEGYRTIPEAVVTLGPWRVFTVQKFSDILKIGPSRVGVSFHSFPPIGFNHYNTSLTNSTSSPVLVLAIHFNSPVVKFRDVRFTLGGSTSKTSHPWPQEGIFLPPGRVLIVTGQLTYVAGFSGWGFSQPYVTLSGGGIEPLFLFQFSRDHVTLRHGGWVQVSLRH